MASLNQRQIEAFRAVMMAGGITSAARILNVTQPAVSRLIRDLQLAMRLKLFERQGTRILPTSEALSLYQEVERSFVGLDRIVQAATDLHARRAGTLRIAAYPALATSFLPYVVAKFLKDRPKLHVSVMGLGSRIVLDQVASGQCDIGFASDVFEYPSVVSVSIKQSSAVAVVPAGHPLARKSVLKPRDFRDQPFITLGQFTLMRHRIDHAFSAHRVQRQVHVETQLTEIACGLVAAGVGVSIVDPLMAEEFKNRGVVARPFSPRIDVEFAAMHQAQRNLSGVAAEFIDMFRQELAERLHRQALRPPAGRRPRRG
ncbi:MAG: LysR family transcriptional regulator [Rhodospirillales bacterium]|nr:LysR family transcriptional regulator [Rhodospirillales bacterium]